MLNSPLLLEEYVLRELQFSLISDLKNRPDRAAQYDGLSIEVTTEVEKRDGDLRKWRCELTVESKAEKGANHPYKFRVTYVGFFSVAETYPAERVEMMARTNTPALLYSAAREALLPLTGRGPFPAILLPSVTFLEPPKAQGNEVKANASQKGSSKLTARKGAAGKSTKKAS
jgi:preprotein translocase subunit SecB